MSAKKKLVRQKFRDSVFKRDFYKCVTCGFQSSKSEAENQLDAHHITNREAMPNGGYVAENGVSLCSACHIKAEEFYSLGSCEKGFTPTELYDRIGSSKQSAFDKSTLLA